MKLMRTSNQVGRVTPCAPSGCSPATARRGLTRPTSADSAFTMVEIALSLAIIGFALVAIIGVLPAGLNVQRNNREETIINQESGYFMDALRSGARGLDELTNRVMSITNYWTEYNTNTFPWTISRGPANDGYTVIGSSVTSTNGVAVNNFMLVDGYRVISLLGRPKFEYIGSPVVRSNHVVALVRAIAGAATEKPPQATPSVLDLGFSYRLLVEIHDVPLADKLPGQAQSLSTNLHEVRLRFSWPLLPGGRVGSGRQTFRSMAGGQHQKWIEATNNHPIFYFNPSVY